MLDDPGAGIRLWRNLRGRFTLDNRWRFILLIGLLNFLLFVIVLLTLRNQEIVFEIQTIEREIHQAIEILATVQAEVVEVVYITATPSPTVEIVPTATPTSTPTEAPPPTTTSTPVPPATSSPPPTSPPTPTSTGTPTLVPTDTPTPTFTPTAMSTSTPTATPSPTPTFTPTPTPTPEPPHVDTISPDTGSVDDVALTVTITGSHFQAGATVRLQQGGSSILATGVTVISETQVTCTFDLSGQPLGAWDVVVTNPDSHTGTLPDGFTVVYGALHHFTFDAISQQVINVSFPITITAQDRYDNRITTYTAAATLTDTTSTVSLTITSDFTAGLWSGPVGIGAVGMDIVITATSTADPGVVGTSNPFTVTHPTPTVLGVDPNEGLSTMTTPVTITGTNFATTPEVLIGATPALVVTWVNSATLSGTVPAGMSPGIYNVTVRNPGPTNPSGTLAHAFTVRGVVTSPNQVLDYAMLRTNGLEAPDGYGDDDRVQVIFFELPANLSPTTELYFNVFDPDCGGSLDNSPMTTTFSVLGGNGAYTNELSRAPFFTDTNRAGVLAGTTLVTRTFGISPTVDNTWVALNTAPIPITNGEHVGDKYIFKLAVEGLSGSGGNVYDVSIGTSPATTDTVPAGTRIFAYGLTFHVPTAERPHLYPYVTSDVTEVHQYNFDFDAPPGAMTFSTPSGQVFSIDVSGEGEGGYATSSHSAAAADRDATWTVDMESGVGFDNCITFYATDQNGNALAIFGQPYGGAPPPLPGGVAP